VLIYNIKLFYFSHQTTSAVVVGNFGFKIDSEFSFVPERKTTGSEGFDLQSCSREPIILPPLGRAVIPIGVAVIFSSGFHGQIFARSGLASKYGINVMGGLIDQDYEGPLKVILHNSSADSSFRVKYGMRVAQLAIRPSLLYVESGDYESRNKVRRGQNGFGHTGLY
jgi:dUTP pyrophosphatase